MARRVVERLTDLARKMGKPANAQAYEQTWEILDELFRAESYEDSEEVRYVAIPSPVKTAPTQYRKERLTSTKHEKVRGQMWRDMIRREVDPSLRTWDEGAFEGTHGRGFDSAIDKIPRLSATFLQ